MTTPTRVPVVLIIEDDPDGGRSMADALEVCGARTVVASDGRTGVELARETRPDVVLCDLGLPDISGFEVAEALRREPSLEALLLIAVSGYAGREDQARSRAAGFDAHLAKPPDLDELLRRIGLEV